MTRDPSTTEPDELQESKVPPPRRVSRRPIFAFKKQPRLSSRILLGLAAWILFITIWQLATTLGWAPPALLPSPFKVMQTLYTLFAEREFIVDVGQSLRRILISFGIATAIALPLGILMGAFSVVESFANALVSPFRYLPAPSFIPLLLMWMGTGDEQKIALLVLGVIWFLVTLFMDNTKAVEKSLIETSQTLGANRRRVLWRVIFPAALPFYVDSARQMLAVSWTYLVIAEIVAATDGIGAMMMRAKRFVRVDEIMAGILIIGILGLLFDLLMRWIHRNSFRYLHP